MSLPCLCCETPTAEVDEFKLSVCAGCKKSCVKYASFEDGDPCRRCHNVVRINYEHVALGLVCVNCACAKLVCEPYPRPLNAAITASRPSINMTKIEASLNEQLDLICGMESIKQELRMFLRMEFCRAIEHDILVKKQKAGEIRSNLVINNVQPPHICLKGPAGSGKTSIAKIIAGILFELRIVKEKTVKFIASGQDLTGGHIGETAKHVESLLAPAKEGVCFIDETYTMTKGGSSYGTEAVNAIMKAMGDIDGNPRNPCHCVFIFAGYVKDMDHFLSTNPGLKSRLYREWTFAALTASDIANIFLKKLDNYQFVLRIPMDRVTQKVPDRHLTVKTEFERIPSAIVEVRNGALADTVLNYMKELQRADPKFQAGVLDNPELMFTFSFKQLRDAVTKLIDVESSLPKVN